MTDLFNSNISNEESSQAYCSTDTVNNTRIISTTDNSTNKFMKFNELKTSNEKKNFLAYFGSPQSYNMNIKEQLSALNFPAYNKYSSNQNNTCNGLTGSDLTNNNLSNTTTSYMPSWLGNSNINLSNMNNINASFQSSHLNNNSNNQFNNNSSNFNRNRFALYQNRSYSTGNIHSINNQPIQQSLNQSFSYGSYPYIPPATFTHCNKVLAESSNFNNNNNNNGDAYKKIIPLNNCNNNMLSRNFQPFNLTSSFGINHTQSMANNLISTQCNNLNGSIVTINNSEVNKIVTLQISNLDYSLEEQQLRNFLLNQLKPITPVLSLIFEGSSCAKVTVPDLYYAKLVVSNLHRKKIGHKRVVVSYTRDSSSTEISTLRWQVAGLLKDVPYCTLPMYKFRELFQSRFKTSISVLDLYKMQDICNITTDKNDDKHISLNSDLIASIENNPLMEGLHESVPYCSLHFQKEQHKGWAEQEIEQLPNVFMTISEMKQIICPLLKSHVSDIPVSSLVYCIAGELGIQINRDENGVNLEHLVCCVNGIQISNNNFGIKILGWLEPENVIGKENISDRFVKSGSPGDPLYQISKEVIELIKMSPKSTMKFNRFIPAYHNHFGKQCRVADYGYTKLIELFEALSSVVQIMGDGENRQITLTHRTQIRRFTTDLLRIIRSQGNKSILLSQLPEIFYQTQNRLFDITDYGVCAIEDILDGLANSNIIVITPLQNGNDILISIPKRKQTVLEIEKTCTFAGEVVELFCNAPQYSILFQKFVRSYHYHFGYQCRLSDYGFLKLADLMEAIQGVVEIELTNDEDKKIFLSPKVARRVFAEQLEDLIKINTGEANTCMKLDDVLLLHKKKYGYQIQSQTLGFANIFDAIKELPYVEIIEVDSQLWITCHLNDAIFRNQTYQICRIILNADPSIISLEDLLNSYLNNYNEILTEKNLLAMKHAIDIKLDQNVKIVIVTRLMRYIMKVLKVIDQYKTLTLGEIKKYLSITLGDCFEIGYPNITTFIRAYPDVFNFEMNTLIDRSKITLIPTCALFPNKTNCNNSVKNQNQQVVFKAQENKTCPSLNSSLSSLNSSSQPLSLYNRNILQDDPFQSKQFQKNSINDDIFKNYVENDKENQYLGEISTQNLVPANNKKYPPGLSLSKHQFDYSNNHHHHLQHHYHHQQQQQLYQQQQFSHQQQQLIPSYYGKDNLFNTSFNSSNTSVELNSSALNINLNSLSLSNGSSNSVTSSSDGMNISNDTNLIDVNNNDPLYDFPKLWNKGNNEYFNNNLIYSETDDIFELLQPTKSKSTGQSDLYNKDNVDNSDTTPFWVDPIWSNDNKNSDLSHDQKNSTVKDPTKFDMPELQTFNVILPMALSSYELLDTENMKKDMFSLDSSDEKL